LIVVSDVCSVCDPSALSYSFVVADWPSSVDVRPMKPAIVERLIGLALPNLLEATLAAGLDFNATGTAAFDVGADLATAATGTATTRLADTAIAATTTVTERSRPRTPCMTDPPDQLPPPQWTGG
jgi:hypothetical protein